MHHELTEEGQEGCVSLNQQLVPWSSHLQHQWHSMWIQQLKLCHHLPEVCLPKAKAQPKGDLVKIIDGDVPGHMLDLWPELGNSPSKPDEHGKSKQACLEGVQQSRRELCVLHQINNLEQAK